VAAIALALGASLAWGAADFGGGLLTRRFPVVSVAVVSQAAGFVALALVALVAGAAIDGEGFAIGLLAGVGGGLGLAALYRALSVGTVSIVAPVAACGAVVPLVLSLAAGDDPPAIALVGAIVALAGAVIASLEERAAEEAGRRDAIALAAAAALLLGLFVFFLGRASQHGGALSALLGARSGSLTLLLAWALAVRPSVAFGRQAAAVVGVGVLDVVANALFALASREGLLAIVSVMGSLYPIPTVVLAHVVLRERISATQRVGVLVALAGVTMVASGGS
jgi:drug/metabolite transporter (DMT)-like permease